MGMIVNPFNTVAGATDPSFGSVLILAHFDGANGATGPYTNSATATGAPTLINVVNCTTDNSQFKFGTTSLKSNAAAGPIVDTSTGPLDIGTGDFTDEFWYFNTNGTGGVGYDHDYGAVSTNPSTSYGTRHSLGTIRFFANSFVDKITSGSVLLDSTWQHIAISRASGTTRLFVDGTQVGSNFTDSNNYLCSNRIYIGRIESAGGALTWFDDWRLTVGVGRYTSNFTPPTAAFPNS